MVSLFALMNDPTSIHARTTCSHRNAPERSGELWERLTEDENVVIDEDGEPVAFASWQTYGPWVHLNVMVVSGRRQRSGLGVALLEAFMAQARDDGAAGFTLRAYADSPWALAFYERHGLNRVATRTDWEALDADLRRHLIEALPPAPGWEPPKVLFYRRL